jgi:hypothetical protein
MDELLVELFDFLKSGGWFAVVAFVGYLTYRVSMVGIVTLGVYKAIRLIVKRYESRNLEERIAAEMGTKTPLTAHEESKVLEAVRNVKWRE